MRRVRFLALLALVVMLGATLTAAVQAQDSQRSRRGFGGDSLLGLLRLEQVQKEMELDEEQAAKVKEIVEKLGAEMREEFTALRDMEDREKRMEKYLALGDQFDDKVREQLRDVVKREQLMRLYQIRLQVRAVVDSLANRYVAGRLELTDDQKEKLAAIKKDTQAKQMGLFSSMREASQEQRREAFSKYREMRSDAQEQALAVLTDEQKKKFEEMKGKIIELERGER